MTKKCREKITKEQKNQTLASDSNITNISKKKKKKYNANKIMYFNYNKKNYYINNYTKLKNQSKSE